MSWNDQDFWSADPWTRFNAHQAAKGRPLLPDQAIVEYGVCVGEGVV